jgi:hypothetical protein
MNSTIDVLHVSTRYTIINNNNKEDKIHNVSNISNMYSSTYGEHNTIDLLDCSLLVSTYEKHCTGHLNQVEDIRH